MKSLKSLLAPKLETGRLSLELFDYSPAHYEALLGSMNSATAHARMGDFGIRTAAEFDALNRSTRLSAALIQGHGDVDVDTDLYYLVRLKSAGHGPGALAGGVSLAQRSARLPPDAGWCLLEAHHGKGYAAEAARRLIEYAADSLGIRDVMAWPGESNVPSCRTAEKAGFVLGGSIEDNEGKAHVVYLLPGMDFSKLQGEKLSLFGSGQ